MTASVKKESDNKTIRFTQAFKFQLSRLVADKKRQLEEQGGDVNESSYLRGLVLREYRAVFPGEPTELSGASEDDDLP
jgi:hypothetical protein